MLRKFFLSLLLIATTIPGWAQQNQVQETTKIPYAYNKYQDATLTMLFGSKKKVQANIYYDGSRLYFLKDSVPMQATLNNIIKADFPDATYIAVNDFMAKVVAVKDEKMLLCVKTIDKDAMRGRDDGMHDRKGEGLPFFQLEGFGMIDMAGTDVAYAKENAQFPIMRTYYIRTADGTVLPAKESILKKRLTGDKKKQFKIFTENRLWSWKDEDSLKQLLDFF
jgi:hypothetical protein